MGVMLYAQREHVEVVTDRQVASYGMPSLATAGVQAFPQFKGCHASRVKREYANARCIA